MTTHIFETGEAGGGVSLQVEYARDAAGVACFQSIHVLDVDYRPVGPDLSRFLHNLVILQHDNPPEGIRLLALVHEEINEQATTQRAG